MNTIIRTAQYAETGCKTKYICLIILLFSGLKHNKIETNKELKSDRYSFRIFHSENKCEGDQTNEEYISVNTESKPKPSDRGKEELTPARTNCPSKLPPSQF